MKNKGIMQYRAPRVVEHHIELEQGILASSATFTPGDGTEGNSKPLVQDWFDDTERQEIDL